MAEVALGRLTPNRMWYQRLPDGTMKENFGLHTHEAVNPYGRYEELISLARKIIEYPTNFRADNLPEPKWVKSSIEE